MRTLASSFLVAGLLAAAGCLGGGGGDDDYPIQPGGGPPGTHDPAPALRGRVCLATDLRDFGTCSEDGAGGLTVSVGGASTVTEADGRFTLPRPDGPIDGLLVSGPGVFPTMTPLGPGGSADITAIDADTFARELTSNGVLLPEGTGSILGRVVSAGDPASGIGVTSAPTSPFGPFYDGGGAFTLDRTGARGVFFVPGLTAGTATLTFRDATGVGETIVNGVTVRNGGITILDSVPLP